MNSLDKIRKMSNGVLFVDNKVLVEKTKVDTNSKLDYGKRP